MHRLGNVFQLLEPEVIEASFGFILHLLVSSPGYDYAARFGYGLEAGCDIHAIAIEIASLDHDVTEIDAYPEHDLRITIYEATIAEAAVVRIQIDQYPFQNPKVRSAVKLATDQGKTLV